MDAKELILKRLRAAHAIISEAESLVKNCSMLEMQLSYGQKAATKDSRETVTNCHGLEEAGTVSANASGDNPVATSLPTSDAPTAEDVPAETIVQQDLFTDIVNVASHGKDEKPVKDGSKKSNKPVHKRGTPSISYKEAMANFRRIIGDRKIVDLKDVNEVFGYNKSTSGQFIKNAIRRGELSFCQSGALRKFVAKNVKNFVKAWYDSQKAAKDN